MSENVGETQATLDPEKTRAALEEAGLVEAPAKDASYTVLVEYEVESLSGTDRAAGQKMKAWVEAGTYTVPPRTHRKKLVTQALKDVGMAPDPAKPAPRVRVLDAESALVHEPEAKQPPAEWVVS